MDKLILAVNRAAAKLEKFNASTKKSATRYNSADAVQVRMDKLDVEWGEFSTAWKAWQNAADLTENEPEFDDEYLEEIEDVVERARLELIDIRGRLNVAPAARVDVPVNAGGDAPADGQPNPPLQLANLRLPAIQPPTFNGEWDEWVSFRDVFTALVIRNLTLSDTHRLHLLRVACVGKAADEIANIQLAEGNFATAWEVLVKKFENARLLIFRLIERMISIPVMKRECVTELSQLLNGTNQCMRALRVLNRQTENWDDFLVVLTVTKLDIVTRTAWERAQGAKKVMPTYEQLEEFLNGMLGSMEALKNLRGTVTQSNSRQHTHQSKYNAHTHVVAASGGSGRVCMMCKGQHGLYNCPQFLERSIRDRRCFVEEQGICFRCISTNKHRAQTCNNRFKCRVCNQNHHTLLHIVDQPAAGNVSSNATTIANSSRTTTIAIESATSAGTSTNERRPNPFDGSSRASTNMCTAASVLATRETLLPTAWVMVTTADGRKSKLRALVDQGSQVSIISRQAVQRLGMKRLPSDVQLDGVAGSSAGKTYGCVRFTAAGCNIAGKSLDICALVLSTITADLPIVTVARSNHPLLSDLQLADTKYWQTGRIDVLLGAAVVAEMLQHGVRRADGLVAQETEFGWMVSGTTSTQSVGTYSATCATLQLDGLLQRFWEQEEVFTKPMLSADDERCETIFNTTTTRNEDGRYVVELPFRQGGRELGESQSGAIRRLKQMEARGLRYPNMYEGYKLFMRKYLELEHMERIPTDEVDAQPQCYLPHHAVFKPDSSTTKLRVVFDATAATSNGQGLNALLLTGPRLQENLTAILMRWRGKRICFSADIEKMYRQILVKGAHQDYQRIVWREEANQPIQHYRLKTVTYGTASAPYTAVKTIQQLADDEQSRWPKAAQVVKNDFYVDDCMAGGSTVEEAIELKDQLLGLMSAGGFRLLKWSSNSDEFLRTLPDDHIECRAPLCIDEDASIKALGVHWYPTSDEIGYKVSSIELAAEKTKRQLLSDIAKLFDPLGLLAPVIITAKIIMQSLWLTGLGWDESLPEELVDRWCKYQSQLSSLEEIRVPRWFGQTNQSSIQLHGFSDASMMAYAACVYMRVEHSDGKVMVTLLAAKTKVAPIKQLSVPRLELNGAVLLSQLLVECRQALRLGDVEVFAWTDSTVVLAWIRRHSNVWQQYVANRVGEIQRTMNTTKWQHVPGTENPADVASRGIMPAELRSHELWWSGPQWLRHGNANWPKQQLTMVDDTLLEAKKVVSVNTTEERKMWELANAYSSWRKLLRITALCRRMLKGRRQDGPVTANEVEEARIVWLRLVQAHEFGVVSKFMAETALRKHSFKKLSPYIDAHGLMRVGGRLANANLAYDELHPVILPGKNCVTARIIQDAHERVCHGGPQATSGYLHQRYWLINERRNVRACVHRCMACAKARPRMKQQLMGNLPAARVRPMRPFLHTAVDYAGPIWSRTARGRGQKAHKSWIAVFVCLSSKAIHIELVSELTSTAFIAAFRRFTARRGLCSDIYCDNGTNFVGSDRELRQQLAKAMQDDEWRAILADSGTKFHFSPPGSPHFNGLAEASVRMAKSAMNKVIGDTKLTYEEMATFLTQVEAALNSRPLSAMSADSGDANVLTPGHFITGQPLLAVPEPNLLDDRVPLTNRWRMVQQMSQQFWKRWGREYLHQLQERSKWQRVEENVRVGDVVVIQDENKHTTYWKMGRVVETHAGADGLVRVATVKTASGMLKRAVTKLCVLPVHNDAA